MKARNDNNQNKKKMLGIYLLQCSTLNRAAVLFAVDFPPKQKKNV
jgi:hypothetical protein